MISNTPCRLPGTARKPDSLSPERPAAPRWVIPAAWRVVIGGLSVTVRQRQRRAELVIPRGESRAPVARLTGVSRAPAFGIAAAVIAGLLAACTPGAEPQATGPAMGSARPVQHQFAATPVSAARMRALRHA